MGAGPGVIEGGPKTGVGQGVETELRIEPTDDVGLSVEQKRKEEKRVVDRRTKKSRGESSGREREVQFQVSRVRDVNMTRRLRGCTPGSGPLLGCHVAEDFRLRTWGFGEFGG